MSLHTWVTDPEHRIRLHTWVLWIWVVLTLATTAWALLMPENRYLLAWVIFMSGYAIVATHWAGREGAAPSAKEGP